MVIRCRTACSVVRSGPSQMHVAVLHSLEKCHRHSLGDSLIFSRRIVGLCCPPNFKTDLHNRTGNRGWPTYSSQSCCSSCVSSCGWSSVPVVLSGRSAIVSSASRHVCTWSGSLLVRQTILLVNRNGLLISSSAAETLKKCARVP